MYIYMYIYICIPNISNMYIYIHKHIHIHTNTYKNIHIHLHTCIYTYYVSIDSLVDSFLCYLMLLYHISNVAGSATAESASWLDTASFSSWGVDTSRTRSAAVMPLEFGVSRLAPKEIRGDAASKCPTSKATIRGVAP